jgi:DnaJ-class molecular chaperone
MANCDTCHGSGQQQTGGIWRLCDTCKGSGKKPGILRLDAVTLRLLYCTGTGAPV